MVALNSRLESNKEEERRIRVQGAGCAFKVLREGPATTAPHAFHAQIEASQRQRWRFLLLGESARRSRPTRSSYSLMQPAPTYRCCLHGPPHLQWRADAERAGGRYPENHEGRPGDWPCTRSASDTPRRTGSPDCCIARPSLSTLSAHGQRGRARANTVLAARPRTTRALHHQRASERGPARTAPICS